MDEWLEYRKTAVTEMRRWFPGYPMERVSVSPEDRKNGSPKEGDMIARNPANHNDEWLVAEKYFNDNYQEA